MVTFAVEEVDKKDDSEWAGLYMPTKTQRKRMYSVNDKFTDERWDLVKIGSLESLRQYVDNDETQRARIQEILSSRCKTIIEHIGYLHVQQSINCCNVTAVAAAFNLLGAKHLTVNRVFYMCQLNVLDVINSGLTLAQTFTVAQMVARRLKMNFFCERLPQWMHRPRLTHPEP